MTMSEAPTRHSRRLGGEPPSPQPPIPARSRRTRPAEPSERLANRPETANEDLADESAHGATSNRMNQNVANPLLRYGHVYYILGSYSFPLYSFDPLLAGGTPAYPNISMFEAEEALPVHLTERDAATFRELMSESQSSPENHFTSSPPYPLATPSEDPLDSFNTLSSDPNFFQSSNPSPGLHSPRAVYPNSRSTS
ncbi:hypothetical protein B0H10DRAFT_2239394 [Mycena sp. CBHHK59/15]|nr:hypothetical protein B0H10DRAFT_2239394 [Mycena sp. CBHHK59/15]